MAARWWTFDPRTVDPARIRIVVGLGRDDSDVAMATTVGESVARVDGRDRPGAEVVAHRW